MPSPNSPALGAAYAALAPSLAALKPSEQPALAGQLQAAGLPEEGVNTVTALHGYLTALAIGPRDIEPEEWLAHLWEGGVPAAQGEQLTRLLTAIARMRAGIEADFQRSQPKLPIPGLQPAAAPDMAPIERRGYLMLWCGGFMHAALFNVQYCLRNEQSARFFYADASCGLHPALQTAGQPARPAHLLSNSAAAAAPLPGRRAARISDPSCAAAAAPPSYLINRIPLSIPSQASNS